jgi:hypothetical protein
MPRYSNSSYPIIHCSRVETSLRIEVVKHSHISQRVPRVPVQDRFPARRGCSIGCHFQLYKMRYCGMCLMIKINSAMTPTDSRALRRRKGQLGTYLPPITSPPLTPHSHAQRIFPHGIDQYRLDKLTYLYIVLQYSSNQLSFECLPSRKTICFLLPNPYFPT